MTTSSLLLDSVVGRADGSPTDDERRADPVNLMRIPTLIERKCEGEELGAEEILGLRLITLHNLYFCLELMRSVRDKIDNGLFDGFRKEFVSNYKTRAVNLLL